MQATWVVIGCAVVGLGHLVSFGLRSQFGGHLASVESGLHRNTVVLFSGTFLVAGLVGRVVAGAHLLSFLKAELSQEKHLSSALKAGLSQEKHLSSALKAGLSQLKHLSSFLNTALSQEKHLLSFLNAGLSQENTVVVSGGKYSGDLVLELPRPLGALVATTGRSVGPRVRPLDLVVVNIASSATVTPGRAGLVAGARVRDASVT